MFFFSFDARYVRVGRVREAEALIGRGLEDAEAALRVVRQLRFRSGRTLLVGAACGREFEVAAPLVALFLQRRNKDKPKTIDNQEASRLNLHQAPDRQPTARKRQKKKKKPRARRGPAGSRGASAARSGPRRRAGAGAGSSPDSAGAAAGRRGPAVPAGRRSTPAGRPAATPRPRRICDRPETIIT